ncbi:uncharacterized protein LOC119657393 [Hermetia illucens]|uniref:uncharacterized protein LOC119657393 n=1 Tax=Hermetia illucens TaxID=343691 RepID=UPI0018CC18B7|nr:uncharacterized protein LOC119657393 [Hermetia illucens]
MEFMEMIVTENIAGDEKRKDQFQAALVACSQQSIYREVTWVLLIQLALCGTVYACLNQYSRYYIRPTVMSVEKDYRSWQGVLPAGTICLANVVDEIKANKIIDGLMAESGNFTEMDREVFMSFLVAVVNATAENYEQLAEFGSEEQLQSLDLYELAMDITRPAGHRVKVTTYDPKVKIELEPIMLEKGLCYTFNTALPSVFRNNVRKETKLRKPLACRYGKQECSLKVEAFDTSISVSVYGVVQTNII